jgi:hypothetical protein
VAIQMQQSTKWPSATKTTLCTPHTSMFIQHWYCTPKVPT